MTGEPERWRSGPRGDALLAAVVTVFVVLTTVVETGDRVRLQPVPALGWLLIAAGCGALVVRRRFPVVVAVVTLVASMLYYPFMDPDGALMVTLVIALYTLAAQGRTATAGVIGAVAVVGSAFGEYGSEASPLGDAGLFLLVSWLVAGVALGAVTYSARRRRDEALRRRATEERLRIARELHDVLGHHISLINVQAAAALHRLERDSAPAPAADALAAIKEASRDALRELRGTLGVLRQVDEEAPTQPAPGLARLPELADRARAAGIAVDVHTAGDPVELSPAVDLAAYRIVQEALTNVTRHAAAGRVAVRIGYARDDVTVDVRDDGRGAGARAGGGSGIDGMRSRAVALGGTLEAADRPEGGFRVTARLPYRVGR